MGAIIEADRDNFRDLVAKGDVLVDVWGPQCQPCFALMPHVEELAAERDSMTVVKVEAPKARRLCIELKVMGLPAFLAFRDGQEVARLGGQDITPTRLRAWVEETLGRPVEEMS